MSIYVKTPDRWEPLVGGSLEGAPGEPYLPDPRGGSVVAFTPGTEGSAGPTIAYGAYITPSGDGAIVEVDQETLEATVSGTEPFVNYVVSIYGVNAAGKGQPASTFPFQLNYNSATGGNETVVDDYNGTGEQWMTHAFIADETFEVTSSPTPFRILVVGSGGRGGFCNNGLRGGGGGAGRMIEDNAFDIAGGSHPVVVGDGTASTFYGINAPAGGTGGNQSGGGGGNGGSGGGGGAKISYIASTPYDRGADNSGADGRGGGNGQTQSGGGGGAATAGGLTGAAGLGRANNISGVEIVYATGGSVGAAPGVTGSGNGGLGAVTDGQSGSYGGSGVVIVRLPDRGQFDYPNQERSSEAGSQIPRPRCWLCGRLLRGLRRF